MMRVGNSQLPERMMSALAVISCMIYAQISLCFCRNIFYIVAGEERPRPLKYWRPHLPFPWWLSMPCCPGGGVGDVDKALTQLNARNNSIGHSVLVGHQPMVSELVDYYLGDHGKVPSLPPGGFVTMSLHVHARGCGELLFWAFPPEYRGFV